MPPGTAARHQGVERVVAQPPASIAGDVGVVGPDVAVDELAQRRASSVGVEVGCSLVGVASGTWAP